MNRLAAALAATYVPAAPGRAVGILLFVSGLAIRWYAIMYLGRFFTVNVARRHCWMAWELAIKLT